jgi:MIP family channel proteins
MTMPDSLGKRLVAEFIGVFTICFIGILAINNANTPLDSAGLLHVALAFGFAVAFLIAALGAISGAHFNPAVTLAFTLARRMEPGTALAYLLAQVTGGVVASYLLAALFDIRAVALGATQLASGVTPVQGTALEVVATFLLVLVIFGSAVDLRAPKYVYPVAIGLVIVADILAIGPLTGASLNPARSFGPALAGGGWAHHWVYWLGPLLGGALAGALQHFFLLPGGLPRRGDEPEHA